MSRTIVYAVPVFFGLMLLEYWIARRQVRRSGGSSGYGLSDTINSISLGIMSQVVGVFFKVMHFGLYVLVWQVSQGFSQAYSELWQQPIGWLLALVLYDFLYYWFHRLSHEVALFWGSHVVHHQSQHYNLSTALRQTSTNLLSLFIYLPMAVIGVPVVLFAIVGLVDLLYQYWVHTERIGRLGWFDRVFVSPSNHRVHHAVNDGYVDKNYGGILILWDRLFGTFKDEDPLIPCVYGTRHPLNSWNPLWANVEVYRELARRSAELRGWNRLKVWFARPGFDPEGKAKAFDLSQVRTFDPATPAVLKAAAGLLFVTTIVATMLLLWQADDLSYSHLLLLSLPLLLWLWVVGAWLENRLSLWQGLSVACAAIAAVSATLGEAHVLSLFKPLALLFLIIEVLRWHSADRLVLAALSLSLLGDVLLLQSSEGAFMAGLVSFLAAHLCYFSRFSSGFGLLPQPRFLLWTAGAGAAAYAVLLPQLTGPLPLAVAVYVVAISLMSAKALHRASALGTSAARQVAIGSLFFMLSDLILALNRFHTPLPWASLWVLSSYYLAQHLMVHGLKKDRDMS